MLEYFVYCYGDAIANLILCAILGMLGVFAKKLATKYVDTDVKKAVAKSAVAFVEQVWKDIHGYEKLKKALETAAVLLKKKGIKFDADEMEILIEAAVAEFNEAFKKPLLDEATADAVMDVPEEESGFLE